MSGTLIGVSEPSVFSYRDTCRVSAYPFLAQMRFRRVCTSYLKGQVCSILTRPIVKPTEQLS